MIELRSVTANKACPWCEGTQLVAEPHGKSRVRVACRICYACGPSVPIRMPYAELQQALMEAVSDAIAAWDERGE